MNKSLKTLQWKRSKKEDIIRKAQAQGQVKPPLHVYPFDFKAQMELAIMLINQLNQDSNVVQRIAVAIDHYNNLQKTN